MMFGMMGLAMRCEQKRAQESYAMQYFCHQRLRDGEKSPLEFLKSLNEHIKRIYETANADLYSRSGVLRYEDGLALARYDLSLLACRVGAAIDREEATEAIKADTKRRAEEEERIRRIAREEILKGAHIVDSVEAIDEP
jgi:hypothetical protein